MAVVQQELCELKMRLEARSGRKISEKDMRLIRKIEQLKEELRELLVELRKRKSEEEHSLILTNVSIYPHPPNTIHIRRHRRRHYPPPLILIIASWKVLVRILLVEFL